MLKEALLYSQQGDKLRCNLCPRRCLIGEGKRGYCLVREDRQGKLFSLIYGEIASLSLNPIEKKPVFHFYPGSKWLSLGTWGCNFRCPGCQNWELSYGNPREEHFLSPQELVNLAKGNHALGISWTFNEPTIWMEYIFDGAKLAKREGLYTNLVTNGYITQEALDFIAPYVDVFRVDIKAWSKQAYSRIAHIPDPSPIFEAVKRAKDKWGMHIELVTNVIPGYNDGELEPIAQWILQEVGSFTPWHITRFFPHLKLCHLPLGSGHSLRDKKTLGVYHPVVKETLSQFTLFSILAEEKAGLNGETLRTTRPTWLPISCRTKCIFHRQCKEQACSLSLYTKRKVW